jgi:hypothetical protein
MPWINAGGDRGSAMRDRAARGEFQRFWARPSGTAPEAIARRCSKWNLPGRIGVAGIKGRSGGSNRLTILDHQQAGTFRASRHAHLAPAPRPALPPVSRADRRRVLRDLAGEPRRVAGALLDLFEGWDPAGLQTLRLYALSLGRLEALQAPGGSAVALHRELRAHVALLRALDLERPR